MLQIHGLSIIDLKASLDIPWPHLLELTDETPFWSINKSLFSTHQTAKNDIHVAYKVYTRHFLTWLYPLLLCFHQHILKVS